jgi:hypothetical protein
MGKMAIYETFHLDGEERAETKRIETKRLLSSSHKRRRNSIAYGMRIRLEIKII